ncbi:MAG: site-specific integrase [Paludibacter sp.]|nr:site-specific integrase [Paludibacter sp.]
MNASVNVLCYKSKTLSNGENPLMIRVCKDGKRTYKSLGISVNPLFWDFTKSKPKRNCPNKEQIEQLISEKKKAFTQTILELNTTAKEYTTNSLIDSVNKPFILQTVEQVFLSQIEQLESTKRKGYALSCKQVYNSLLKFNKHLNIYFSDIDVSWLRKYEVWLRSEGIAENTIGIRFRTLRMMYNIAITEKFVNPECYPFHTYKVSKLHEETAKRALTKSDIQKVIDYNSNKSHVQLAIDIFTFTYFMGGINFVDIAFLTKENIIENQLIYSRKKTGKLIKLPLQPKALEIIYKYQNPENKYLFPILFNYHITEQQTANRIHKVITKVNAQLKKLGKELKMQIDITTYVARHSFATVLKRSGVATSIISESLGHSSEKVTRIYLDGFENSQIDEAMKNLL